MEVIEFMHIVAGLGHLRHNDRRHRLTLLPDLGKPIDTFKHGVQIGGHCKIETGAWFSGMAGAHQFVTVGKWCFVAGLGGLTRDMPPFMMVSGHYPAVVRAVNKRGLSRAGLSEEQQERIQEAYKRLYRDEGALLANARALAEEDLDENVRALVDAIIRSSEHRYGRYRESLRR